jgi:hypothetical protein
MKTVANTWNKPSTPPPPVRTQSNICALLAALAARFMPEFGLEASDGTGIRVTAEGNSALEAVRVRGHHTIIARTSAQRAKSA